MNIIRLLKWLLLDNFRLYGGGGGGGDGGAAARERDRQARIERATSAVNAIFGKGAKSPGELDAMRAQVQQARTVGPQVVGGAMARSIRAVPGPYADSLAQQLAQDEQNAETNQQAAAARDQIYKQVGADTRDYYSKQLAEDADNALRDMRFTQARSGLVGSSQAIDMQREFDRRNDRGLIDVANRADQAQTGLKTADEKARIDLISRIVNGADQGSATSSALSQLSTNAETARQNAMAGRMANVFAGGLDAWRANQIAQGEELARQKYQNQNGNYFDSNGAPVQGTVTR